MGRTVTKDKCISRVDAAAGKASAKSSGTGGGKLKGVDFTPGKNTIYNKK